MLESQFPLLIDWAITSKCNLSCRHCRGFPESELSTERAKKLVAEIAELKPGWVIVEGGEPLLRDDLFELLSLMQQHRLEVHLITNGMRLNSWIIAGLKRLGVKVMISIDGATRSTYEAIRNGASFERVIQSVRHCVKEGILEAINFSILKSNYAEIPALFKLAATMGVKKITLIGLKPCEDYTDELLSPQEYREAIKLTCQASKETGVDFFFDEPFFWSAVKEWGLAARLPDEEAGIVATTTPACAFGEYLFVEVNGDVKPCSYASMIIGNIKEKTIGEIWREVLSSPFFRAIKEPATRTGNCQSCRYLPACKGCRSRTFALTGDWFASDPACPLSLKLVSREVVK